MLQGSKDSDGVAVPPCRGLSFCPNGCPFDASAAAAADSKLSPAAVEAAKAAGRLLIKLKGVGAHREGCPLEPVECMLCGERVVRSYG